LVCAGLSGCLFTLFLPIVAPTEAGSLDDDLGRNDTRVWSAPFRLDDGGSVEQLDLPQRLEDLGYVRVHQRPTAPGEFFWGHEVFWIYRREHRHAGKRRAARLFGLKLRKRDGGISGVLLPDGTDLELTEARGLWLEPELLAESLAGDRAVREPIDLDELPRHAWRAVLAAEDARFFEHAGLDGKSLARAALANVKAGEVTQGGSTITQQLVKNRDLTPKRTLGRKASEAARALALEADYDKREILQSYLDQVYLGHVDGLAVHGLGAASRVYFSKPATELDLGEAALLAAMIQGPNRLSPLRHPQRARERRDWVLSRMAELGWAGVREVAEARNADVRVRPSPPRVPAAVHFLDWVGHQVEEAFPARVEKGRGIVVETTLDPRLQRFAEQAVEQQLAEMRRSDHSLRGRELAAALVALDAATGEVLAYVGGDPANVADRFDRVRRARRQPGSSVKPLLLLEAFEDCGDRSPLNPASRVADEPLRIDLPSGPWEPGSFDGRFRGVVDLRESLRLSLNVPFVRVARWCGFETTAERMRIAGLDLPVEPPPSFSLGALETTPLDLAGAYTVFATRGKAARPLGIRRIEKPGGKRLAAYKPRRRKVVRSSTAYIVHDLLRDAVERGTGRRAAIEGLVVAGKTGTSNDAWFAGDAGGIVAVAWVGLDRGSPAGLGGGRHAAPLWRRFMARAARARPLREVERPGDVVVRRVDPETGLLLSKRSRKGREELFRRRALPRKDRWLRRDRPEPVVR
jgi:penicillin-binding protein 1B